MGRSGFGGTENRRNLMSLSKRSGPSDADKAPKSDYFVTWGRLNTMNDTAPKAHTTASLAALISRASRAGKGLPPVERWEPPFCGDIDMEIRRDGTWFYMGTPIGRMALVELFSTVLRKDEDGRTYLVTPVEKVGIRVEDAPFVAVEMDVSRRDGGPVLTFRTNVGDVVEAGADHPLRFEIDAATGGLKPYLHVRGRLEALLSRAVMYQLVAHGEEVGEGADGMFAVRSAGQVFAIMPVDALSAAVDA